MSDKNKAIWWVLDSIKKEYKENPQQKQVKFLLHNLHTEEGMPSGESQKEALDYLKQEQVLVYSLEPWDMISYVGTDNYGITIYQPKFNQFYRKYSKYKVPEKEQEDPAFRSVLEKEDAKLNQKNRPYCEVENGMGYLVFGEKGPRSKIGKENGQPFKLIQCLTEPFVAKYVNTIFEAIREGIRSDKSGVYNASTDKRQKVKIIKNTIKEVQKGNKLMGKLRFAWDDMETKLWLEYTG